MYRTLRKNRLSAALQSAAATLERKNAPGGTGNEGNPDAEHKEVLKELKRIGDELRTKAEEGEKEIKKVGELSTETKKAVDEALVTQTKLAARLGELEQKLSRGNGNDPGTKTKELKSAGELLIEDPEIKKFVDTLARGMSHSVKMTRQALDNAMRKAFFTEDVATGILTPQRLPGILPLLRARLFIRDMISAGRTTANSLDYVRQTGFTNNAGVVSEGERKPESTINFDLQTARVTTIAHIFKAAKQILDDFPGLQSLVDAELRWGLKYAEERQILFGDGTGINLLGIVPQASAYAAPSGVSVRFSNKIDQLRLAILQAELAYLPATGIVLHPTDWADIELTKTEDGAYVFANPLALATPSLWGKTVVPTPAMDVGSFLTGGFADGAQIFDREEANVVIATQNEDDFVKNMITIRCEERLALVVKRPEAFITGDFEPEASGA